MSHGQNGGEGRTVARSERQRRLIRARMTIASLPPQDIVIRNLSPRGIGASVATVAPGKDQRVAIELPGQQQAEGVVRWVSGKTFGAELDTDLDIDALTQGIARRGEAADQAGWEVSRQHRVATPPRPDGSKLRRV